MKKYNNNNKFKSPNTEKKFKVYNYKITNIENYSKLAEFKNKSVRGGVGGVSYAPIKTVTKHLQKKDKLPIKVLKIIKLRSLPMVNPVLGKNFLFKKLTFVRLNKKQYLIFKKIYNKAIKHQSNKIRLSKSCRT